jgi:SAM-dependent methyltransferase
MQRSSGDVGPKFRRDLYRGTARDYDRYRVPYPPRLIDDLVHRCGTRGGGRLLDLACGTGQLSFALHRHFAEIWAADQEPGMVDLVREKARAAGIASIRPVLSAAEHLPAPEDSFDLVAIGNAFHRLPRDTSRTRPLAGCGPAGTLPWFGADPPGMARSPGSRPRLRSCGGGGPGRPTVTRSRKAMTGTAGTGRMCPSCADADSS